MFIRGRSFSWPRSNGLGLLTAVKWFGSFDHGQPTPLNEQVKARLLLWYTIYRSFWFVNIYFYSVNTVFGDYTSYISPRKYCLILVSMSYFIIYYVPTVWYNKKTVPHSCNKSTDGIIIMQRLIMQHRHHATVLWVHELGFYACHTYNATCNMQRLGAKKLHYDILDRAPGAKFRTDPGPIKLIL